MRPIFGILFAGVGNQYFDVFEPAEKEWFIDAGTYNGDTMRAFCEWAGENMLGGIVELIADSYKNIIERDAIKKLKNIRIYNNATWDKKEKFFFIENGSGSSISSNGKIEVKGIILDELFGADEVTYIKMNVEGSGLKALEGVKIIIISKKPRLAICIYHKPWDVIEIPAYKLSLNTN